MDQNLGGYILNFFALITVFQFVYITFYSGVVERAADLVVVVFMLIVRVLYRSLYGYILWYLCDKLLLWVRLIVWYENNVLGGYPYLGLAIIVLIVFVLSLIVLGLTMELFFEIPTMVLGQMLHQFIRHIHLQAIDIPIVRVGMWGVMRPQPNGQDRVLRRDRLIHNGAARRGGRQFGPFPQGDPRHVANARQIAERLAGLNLIRRPNLINIDDQHRAADWWNQENKGISSRFIPADFPKNRCVFTLGEVNESKFGAHSVLFDPCGSPFCGLTAIDLASGIKPNINSYLEMCQYVGNIQEVGTNVFLRNYAFNRGYNLRMVLPYENDDEDLVIRNLDYMNNPSWSWIILVVVNPDGTWLQEGEDEALENIKHVFLAIDTNSNYTNLKVPLLVADSQDIWTKFAMGFVYSCFQVIIFRLFWLFFPRIVLYFIGVSYNEASNLYHLIRQLSPPYWLWLLDIVLGLLKWFPLLDEFFVVCIGFVYFFKNLSIEKGYSFQGYRYHLNDNDRRTIRDRRDNIEGQDHYALFHDCYQLLLGGQLLFSVENPIITKKILVSVARAVQLYKEIQCCATDDLSISMLSVLKSNYLNSDEVIPGLYQNTIDYVKWLAKRANIQNVNPEYYTRAYNAQGHTAYIGNLNFVAINQFAVSVGRSIFFDFNQLNRGPLISGKFGEGMFRRLPITNNGFKKLNMRSLKIYPRKEVAHCPFGSLVTDKCQLGPGHLCVTDPYTLVAALAGRSMVKIPVEVREFFEFSQKHIDELLNRVDEQGWIDEDPVKNFVHNNRGKRSAKYIRSRVDQYEQYLQGKQNKKFHRNSCFVKFEDSSKVVNGVSRVRPRLIMTMSDYFSMVLSPLIRVVHIWNESYISKYQVKGMDPSEFITKVASFCDRDHIVTDYSAFESSVSYLFKVLEDYFAESLLIKLRMFTTLKHFKKLNKFGRILHCSVGKFTISSRCSGDYFTSTFNCLINYLINYYSAYKRGVTNLSLIVEGDDGLTLPHQIDCDLINKMGFGFSSNVKGSKPGDVDFLRKRWLYDNSYVNIGRSLKNLFWVSDQQKLPLRKQKAILRAKALSYYFMSPGCPVLTSAINFILKKTSGSNYFKGIEKHLSYNVNFDVKKIGKNYGTIPINESMRGPISEGATGFPPIPVVIQLALEERFAKGNLYVGSLLSDYEDIATAELNQDWYNDEVKQISGEMSELLEIISPKTGIEEQARLVVEKYRIFSRQDLVDNQLLPN